MYVYVGATVCFVNILYTVPEASWEAVTYKEEISGILSWELVTSFSTQKHLSYMQVHIIYTCVRIVLSQSKLLPKSSAW